MKKIFLFLAVTSISFAGYSQIEAPQPSPFTKIEQKVGLTDVSLEYSRPGMRGREIFGDLVPYGKIWRTGANDNTKITFSDDVKIDGKELKKGSYSIYSIPKENSWEILFYADSDNWGNPENWDDEKVALKTTAQVDKMPFEMETFTILIDELKMDSATLNFIWENTAASIQFEVPTDAKVTASIDQAMNGPGAGDYFAAATYYHDTEKDLEKAYEWVIKAVEMQEEGTTPFWMLRKKSLIEADLGKKEEAIATAKKSLASAEKAENADYIKLNKDSLKEWGAL